MHVRVRVVIASLLIAIICVSALFFVLSQQSAEAKIPDEFNSRIHPALLMAMRDSTQVSEYRIIIEWHQDPIDWANIASGVPSESLPQTVVDTLMRSSDQQSAVLKREIDRFVVSGIARDVKYYWIAPVISLIAQPQLIDRLAQFENIRQIRLDEAFVLEDTNLEVVDFQFDSYTWDLSALQVDLANDALGLDGSGVVVANIDSGVDWEHPALQEKYRGFMGLDQADHVGNWYVATDEAYSYPVDGNGHGTHTMGTIVGADSSGYRVGVAPGAKWIAVRLFTDDGITYESWIHDALQWVVAPNGDPSLAPDVINNSWGSADSADTRFQADIEAIRWAGILPVFSAGNTGPSGGSISTPAAYQAAFATGAVDADLRPAAFSSRGPSVWAEIKPDIVAPGVDIVSTYPGGGYAIADGTSMAAPHITGIAALLLEADPNLTPDDLEALLRNTAKPIGDVSPNNAAGWGLAQAYSAGLQILGTGEVAGRITSQYGGIIDGAIIEFKFGTDGRAVVIKSDSGGDYRVFLQPGYYDIQISATGYESAMRGEILVTENAIINIDVSLIPLPTGYVFGRVLNQETSQGISAEVRAAGTNYISTTDPLTGNYSLFLPAGEWTLESIGSGYRMIQQTVSVYAGLAQTMDFVHERAPTILLVDTGWWYYDSHAAKLSADLEALGYLHDVHSVKDPFGILFGIDDRPVTDTLTAYDLVIWSAPQDSIGMLGLNNVIESYMEEGGKLIFTGQDLALQDTMFYPSTYLWQTIGAGFDDQGQHWQIHGDPGQLNFGDVPINGTESANNQIAPDELLITNRIVTDGVVFYEDGTLAGVGTERCVPFKSLFFGFGLEGLGSNGERQAVLQSSIDWIEEEPESISVDMFVPTEILIHPPGEVFTIPVEIVNFGILTDTLQINIDSYSWPYTLSIKDVEDWKETDGIELGPCESTTILIEVAVPSDIHFDEHGDMLVSVESITQPLISREKVIEIKTPASVLYVDDERWFENSPIVEAALVATGISYDVWDSKGGDYSPPYDVLKNYSSIIWTTGYDWFRPLTAQDESNLALYLNNGGRLLLSSQDYLDIRGVNQFSSTFLGVDSFGSNTNPTQTLPVKGSLIDMEWLLTDLHYTYVNWSDSILGDVNSTPGLQDVNGGVIFHLTEISKIKTGFASFPIETLPMHVLSQLLQNTMSWFSPLSESRILLPVAANYGDQIPVELYLSGPNQLLDVSISVPEGYRILSADNGWTIDETGPRLFWKSQIVEPTTLGFVLQSPDMGVAGETLRINAIVKLEDGRSYSIGDVMTMEGPVFSVTIEGSQSIAQPIDRLDYVITLSNLGSTASLVTMVNQIPEGLEIRIDDVAISKGDVSYSDKELTWEGTLSAGEIVKLSYPAIVALAEPGEVIINRVFMGQEPHRSGDLFILLVPAIQYFPQIFK